ncbi:hypothetical protein [Dictyobacter arantiisoli]|uniref:Uncharacterized protein n=1 Tax=Dictyobacter arantiisoli TaxID=2014874 RepID=A0A5A5TC09_9CHLR|nr:hypothetical protein [Dictyobacter arantiisoli]GCF08549.1 hypothetical protein KDI_21130 [Dictyobacter arantiisoli]
MSKTKMRCITCGKWFQSANAREVTCPDCTQKARKEKLATKNAPPVSNKIAGSGVQNVAKPVVPPKPKPKQGQGGTNQWLDNLSDVKVGQPDEPPQRPKVAPPVQRDRNAGPGGSGGYRPNYNAANAGPNTKRDARSYGPGAYHVSNGGGLAPSPGQRPPQSYRPPTEGGPTRSGPKPWAKSGPQGGTKPFKKQRPSKPAAPPKPRREKIPPPAPFEPTPEQITRVEERYLALAQPTEFDGIRTQIAKEFSIPKKAVKTIIKNLRDRQHMPSWWEIQTYKGSQEELERIKKTYEPYLPIPPVGVHKLIAEAIDLKPGTVYQAIKTIRVELNLPQYNDPSYHEEELAEIIKKQQAKKEAAAAKKLAAAAKIAADEKAEQTVTSQDKPHAEDEVKSEEKKPSEDVSAGEHTLQPELVTDVNSTSEKD